MYYENRKRWDNDITTAQIEKYLLEKGFKKVNDNNPRWQSFEDPDGHGQIDLDFDPYMHIDEDDDVICYDVPCYAYYTNYYYYDDPRCVTDINDIQYELDRVAGFENDDDEN